MENVTLPLASPIIKLLDTIGNGSGITNAIGNYSTTPVLFTAVVPPNTLWFLNFIKIQVSDTGTFGGHDYGNITNGLINGYSIKIYKNNIPTVLTAGLITYNDQFIHYSFEYQLTQFSNSYWTSSAVLRFDPPFVLCGNLGDRVEITLHDNFTGLTDHTFAIHGSQIKV